MLPQPPYAKTTISRFKSETSHGHTSVSDGVIVAPEPSALTVSVQDVVPREHDAAAHDVTLEAARTKSVSNPAAVEDLAIICQREGARF